MPARFTHSLILGAGPAGLAAAYRLAQAGVEPTVLERELEPGGLLRSLRRGSFIVDLGRKELPNLFPEVTALWEEVLGADYQPYTRRCGVLYHGRIFETSREFQGYRHGLPWPLFFAAVIDLVRSSMCDWLGKPKNYAEYRYRTQGRLLSQLFYQGYEEKLSGKRWATIPSPAGADGQNLAMAQVLQKAFRRLFREGSAERNTRLRAAFGWRHPLKGTGQICDRLATLTQAQGGVFEYNARIDRIETEPTRITAVVADRAGETLCYRPRHVISSLPIEFLHSLLQLARVQPASRQPIRRTAVPQRSTVLVYLFLEGPPRFPHSWLKVTCPRMRAARITNYGSYGPAMVPPGRSCLCIEYCCMSDDGLLETSDSTLKAEALRECSQAQLLDPTRCFDWMVIKLPGVDVATDESSNWWTEERLEMLNGLRAFSNLYHVNKPGSDNATNAALLAVRAILTDNRSTFEGVYPPGGRQRTQHVSMKAEESHHEL